MIDHIVNHVTEVALSVIISIFIINILCETFLSISPVDTLRRLINKITNRKDEE